MDLFTRLLVKLLTLPRQVTLDRAVHVLLFISGVSTFYLLTLRESEEGQFEDYLQRLWKRISIFRDKALGFHLAFIKVIASALTHLLDRIFGRSLFSLQAIGVSVSFALFFANSYFLIDGIKREYSLDNLIDCIVTLTLALAPILIHRNFGRGCKEGGNNLPFRPLRCQFMIRRTDHNKLEAGLITVAETYGLPCFCSSMWIPIWLALLGVYVYRECFSLLFCVTCFPPVLRPFLIAIALVVISISIVSSILFTLFTVVTRFSLKKLASSDSAFNSFMLLLVGSLPLPIFIVLFEALLFLVRHGLNTSGPANGITRREWVVVFVFLVFLIAFFVNTLFLLAPILFFSMAILLLAHRLVWPIVERPIEKLKRTGFTNHPWLIASIGGTLIAFSLGGREAVIKLFKFFGYGAG